jgi:hypothetical protein
VPTVGKFNETDIVNAGTTIRIVKNKSRLSDSLGDAAVVAETYPTDLSTTLQYSQGNGNAALRQFVKQHINVSPSQVDLICR